MQVIEERNIDRAGWESGPWDSEPDKKQWLDEASGLACLIVRNQNGGNLCGYVGVPKTHPLHGKSYHERVTCPADPNAVANTSEAKPWMAWLGESLRGEDDGTIALDALVDVHGGLTYADECQGRICHVTEDGDHVWWFGFDCAHGGDLRPTDKYGFNGPDSRYRDVSYVEGQCRRLAEQLALFTHSV